MLIVLVCFKYTYDIIKVLIGYVWGDLNILKISLLQTKRVILENVKLALLYTLIVIIMQ